MENYSQKDTKKFKAGTYSLLLFFFFFRSAPLVLFPRSTFLCLYVYPQANNFYGNVFKPSVQIKSEMAHCGNLNQTTNHFRLIVPTGMLRKEQYLTGPI